jgi:tetratricopeptide (TPR) repeat protein
MKSYPIWRSCPVFVSSAFRDMHAERDYLQHHVFPEIRERLRTWFGHLEPIDLRWGLDTSQLGESVWERSVLKICLREIEIYRPVMIVLLGDRYGQILPSRHAQAAADEAGFSGRVEGMSMTEMEIAFAMSRGGHPGCRFLFYFREPLPYQQMEPERRVQFNDALSPDRRIRKNHGKLVDLKARLESRFPKSIRRYKAEWSGTAVTGLEAWGESVTEDLWGVLQAGLPPPEKNTGYWTAEQDLELEHFIEDHSRGFAGRKDFIPFLKNVAIGPEANPNVCLVGPAGSGKSAIFARLCRLLETEGILCLRHAVSAGIRSAQSEGMLRRWIAKLRAALGHADVEDSQGEIRELERIFADLMQRVSLQGRVVCLIDGLDQFEQTTSAQHVTWLPAKWPANARLIVTASQGTQVDALRRAGALILDLPGLDRQESADMVAGICVGYHKGPQSAPIEALTHQPDSEERTPPLWLRLAVEQLLLLDQEFFEEAKPDARVPWPERVGQLIQAHAASLPRSIELLYQQDLARTAEIYGHSWVSGFMGLVALSRYGWRQSDLRELLPLVTGVNWDDRTFASVRRSFRAHLLQRGRLGQWTFSHESMRVSVHDWCFADHAERAWQQIIAQYLEDLPSVDPVRQMETMYHLTHAGQASSAAEYYAQIADYPEVEFATRTLATDLISGEGQTPNPRSDWASALARDAALHVTARRSVCVRYLFHLLPMLSGHTRTDTRLSVAHAARAELLKIHESYSDMDLASREAAVSCDHVADLYMEAGDVDRACVEFERGLVLRQESLTRTGDPDRKWDLSVSHSRLGQVYLNLARRTEAIRHYLEDVRLTAELHGTSPLNEQYLNGLWTSHTTLGDLYVETGDFRAAEANFAIALSRAEQWQAFRPQDLERARARPAVMERLGQLAHRSGDWNRAERMYLDCFELRREIHRQDPASLDCARDLAVICDRLASLGTPDRMKYLQLALEIILDLHKRVPDNQTITSDLLVLAWRMACLHEESGEMSASKEAWNICYKTMLHSPLALGRKGDTLRKSLRDRGFSVPEDSVYD